MWPWATIPSRSPQVTRHGSDQPDPDPATAEFPGILKQYTKAAIRTQPRDLLLWSAAYFRCMARGEQSSQQQSDIL